MDLMKLTLCFRPGVWFLFLLLSWVPVLSFAEKPLLVVTEESAPIQTLTDGQLGGPATEIVKATLTRAGIEHRIEVFPWARAVMLVKSQPGVLIYSILRTPEREASYKWIGPIMSITYSLYRLKSRDDILVSSLEDAKTYRTGVVYEDARYRYLQAQGFQESDSFGLQAVHDQNLNYKKLIAGHIDLIAMGDMTCLTEKVDCSELERVLPLKELSAGLYMAFNVYTDDQLVEKVDTAFASIVEDGTYSRVVGNLGKFAGY